VNVDVEQLLQQTVQISSVETVDIAADKVPGANIGDIGFARHKDLGGSKITQFQHLSGGVHEQILRFNISAMRGG
jgi:hypothetical protein